MQGIRRTKILTNTMEWFATFEFIIAFIVGGLLAIYIATEFNNYLLLSVESFLWIKCILETSSKQKENLKGNVFTEKYPHVVKLGLMFLLLISFIFSNKYFISFVVFSVVYIIYLKFTFVAFYKKV